MRLITHFDLQEENKISYAGVLMRQNAGIFLVMEVSL